MEINMYAYAVQYIKAGFAVLPLQPKGKMPKTVHGVNDATTDPAIVKRWWQMWPEANIGIATGQKSGGLCVIDMDIDEDKGIDGYHSLSDWQQSHGSFPDSWISITGRGGYHYFFKSKEPIKNSVGIIEGVDVRGDGGYIVAPPSLHPNGNRYEWDASFDPEDTELTYIDDTIRYFLAQGSTKPIGKYLSPAKIPDGERNYTLFRFACMMQAKGSADQTVYAATMAENESKCNPPLSEEEIKKIVDSALKYEKGKPIYFTNQSKDPIQGCREPIFETDEKGRIKKTWDNICEAIEFDSELYGHIKYNLLTNSIFVYGALPWEKVNTYRSWKDSDDASLKSYLEKMYGFNKGDKIMDALTIIANKFSFNPVVDELEQIHRDYKECTGAIRKLLPTYLGAEDSEYNFEVMKIYMLGAISRAFYPGCKFDYTIILYGGQGAGKSEFFRHLSINPDWFNDNFNTFEGSKAAENISGMWMIELAELKALKSAKDSETIKAFLTSRSDTYRGPWERRTQQRPRMCVFAGTTNNKNIFVDKTGNRRFLPIEINKGNIKKNVFDVDQDSVMDDFKRAWSEAMQIFIDADKKPQLILPDHINAIAEAMQDEFSEDDYRVGMIQQWLNDTDCNKVCVPMLIESALQIDDWQRVPKQQKREVMEIMDNEIEGWSRVKTKDKGRTKFNKYGNQVTFIREKG